MSGHQRRARHRLESSLSLVGSLPLQPLKKQTGELRERVSLEGGLEGCVPRSPHLLCTPLPELLSPFALAPYRADSESSVHRAGGLLARGESKVAAMAGSRP